MTYAEGTYILRGIKLSSYILNCYQLISSAHFSYLILEISWWYAFSIIIIFTSFYFGVKLMAPLYFPDIRCYKNVRFTRSVLIRN